MADRCLTCKITGGRDSVSIDYQFEVAKQDSFLMSLTEKLALLKDSINTRLTELVDEEKKLIANGSRPMKYDEAGESGNSTLTLFVHIITVLLCRWRHGNSMMPPTDCN